MQVFLFNRGFAACFFKIKLKDVGVPRNVRNVPRGYWFSLGGSCLENSKVEDMVKPELNGPGILSVSSAAFLHSTAETLKNQSKVETFF